MTAVDPWARVTYAEHCMECMSPTLLHPVARTWENGQTRCRYLCPCGNDWTCSWSVGAVEGWDGADEVSAA